MKHFLSLLLISLAGICNAQFFNSTKGTTLLYNCEDFMDGKNKVYTDTFLVTDTYTSGDTLIAKHKNIGKKSNITEGEDIITFKYTKDGITNVSLINAENEVKAIKETFIKGYKEADSLNTVKKTEKEIEADFKEYQKYFRCEGSLDITLHPEAKNGEKFPESSFIYKLGPIKLRASINKGKVEGWESVSTEAGTFNCIKISYCIKQKIMLFSDRVYVTDWYAENIGLVKRIETNKKGKISSSSILSEIHTDI